jgi:hypothetical protein
MRVIVGAVMAALTTTCAQAQEASPPPKDFVEVAFNMGRSFGMAEAMVQSCPLSVVDPKIRQGVMANFPDNYMDTFKKGFAFGWREALQAADKIMIGVDPQLKRCVLAHEMYGPTGTVYPNLIIHLGQNGKR